MDLDSFNLKQQLQKGNNKSNLTVKKMSQSVFGHGNSTKEESHLGAKKVPFRLTLLNTSVALGLKLMSACRQ